MTQLNIRTIPDKKSEDWYDYMRDLDTAARLIGAPLAPTITTIPYAATIVPDASAGTVQRVSLSGNLTIGVPTNASEGQPLIFELTATGAGGWAVTLAGGAGGFKFGTDITSIPALPSGTTLRIGVTYRSSTGRWDVVSVLGGF